MTGGGKRTAGKVLLEVRDLHASVEGREILKGVDLTVRAGEVHAIMGPNGSGKSTLAQVLAGHPAYAVTAGAVLYEGKDLLAMTPEDRAREGVFLAFQYPVAIRGITNAYFLRAAVNAIRKHRGQEELGPVEFMDALEEKLKVIGWDEGYLSRPVNEGFSGGEKKRNEILQMAVLDPKLAILDETDSGLDIDALKTVAHTVDRLRRPDNATVLITHYYRILTHIEPDFVHVLSAGRIVKSGGKELALELEMKGYDWLREEAVVA
jgi:Fe-S cluster assembly ATP-binding protein